jgi:L-fuconolactonase
MVEAPNIARPYGIADVAAEHAAIGVTSLVLVQAADNIEDSENMLRSARENPQVAGVVVWLPLTDASAAEAQLDRWHGEPVVGVRHLVHRDPDPDLLRDPSVFETLAMLGERGLTFDVCAESLHLLEIVPEVADRCPGTVFVVDHLAKPPVRERGWQPWAQLFAAASERPNVVAKLSGLNTAAATGWTSADLSPYVDHALATFGPDRLMYGGDWPFALLNAQSYTQVWRGLRSTLDALPSDARRSVLSGTACRVYGLGPADPSDQEHDHG